MAKAAKHRGFLALYLGIATALHWFAPMYAEAATGLFSVKRTFYSDQVGDRNRTRTASFPAMTGYVESTTLPRFTVPQSAIKNTTGYAACTGWTCRIYYPYSKAWYSYWNLRGSFRPNNPYAATAATTVRFPTAMGNSGPPLGTGEPVSPTTTFQGRYDFLRGGSIMVTPGVNRFGGTMRFFHGPNQRYYQYNTVLSVAISKSYGGGSPPLSTYQESKFGEFVAGRTLKGYRMTSYGHVRTILTPTSFQQCTSLTPPNCEYYQFTVRHLSTIVPFTTGKVSGYQPLGGTTTVHTVTGYDNRTIAGLNGAISLVRPRLVHNYRIPWTLQFNRIGKITSSLSVWRINFQFLPEPSAAVMLAAGSVALAGLNRFHRKRNPNR